MSGLWRVTVTDRQSHHCSNRVSRSNLHSRLLSGVLITASPGCFGFFLSAVGTEHGPPKDSERFVVLTTPGSFLRHVRIPMTYTSSIQIPRSRKITAECRGDFWSRAIRDESHEECSNGKTADTFRNLPLSPPCWFLSGTPYEKDPADMLYYVAVLERPTWTHDYVDPPGSSACLPSPRNIHVYI